MGDLYGTYEVPFGPGKTFANDDTAFNYYVVDGWQVNAISSMQSGTHYCIVIANTEQGVRAKVVPGVNSRPTQQSINQ